MLSIHILSSAGKGGSGVKDIVKYMTEGEYYTESASGVGRWYGGGCKSFGLVPGQPVDQEAFANMLSGYHPDGSQIGRQAPGENHVCGFDMTFSSPKSVSLARARANPATRALIDQTMLEARKAALDYAESQGAFVSRFSKDGVTVEEPAKPVFAMFSHHGNRAKDPNEHYHVVALNAVIDDQGRGGTLKMTAVLQRKKEFGAVCRAFEARALQKAGFTVERDGQSYRVVMFSKAVEKHFSKSNEKILAKVGAGASYKTKVDVATSVRDAKTAEDPAVADRRWKDEILAASGIDGAAIDASLGVKQELSSVEAAPRFDLAEIIDQLSDRGPYFRIEPLREAIAIASQGVYSVEIEQLVEAALADERLVAVYQSAEAGPWMTKKGGAAALSEKDQANALESYEEWKFKFPHLAARHPFESYVSYVQDKWETDNKTLAADAVARATKPIGFTTRETLHADREIARFVEKATNAQVHAISKDIVDKAVADFVTMKNAEDPRFTKISIQQTTAICHMTTGNDLAIVNAPAGFGKSTVLDPVARSFEAAGYKVIGLSFQNTNSTALATDAGIETFTIDKFIGMTRPGPRRPGEERLVIAANTVIILDEGGQVGGAKLHAVQRIVEEAGAKLIVTGHTQQMQPMAGTAAMKLMIDVAGEGKSLTMTETQRQIDKDHGIALTALSEGDAVGALVKHAADGKFSIIDGEGFEEAAAAYYAQVEEVGVDKAFVLCDTNAAMRRTKTKSA